MLQPVYVHIPPRLIFPPQDDDDHDHDADDSSAIHRETGTSVRALTRGEILAALSQNASRVVPELAAAMTGSSSNFTNVLQLD